MIEGATIRSVSVDALSFTVHEIGAGRLVLCLHGFPDTARTFRVLLPALSAAGYRAAAPVMRGYEPSSKPADGDYSMAALSQDVLAIANALDDEPAHLVGHDWGASIAYAAASRAPHRWLSLTTLAVPHPAAFAANLAADYGQLRRSWYMYLFQMRGMAEAIVGGEDFAFLRALWRDWSPDYTPDPSDMAALFETFSKPGVLEAALAYYRTAFDPAAPRAGESAAIWTAPVAAPTLGLTGERDGCISPDIFTRSMPQAMFARGVDVRRVRDAGHFLHLERPDEVNALIIAFLARHGKHRE
ncbi:MAG: alpha/beta fold hydrolase [Alphaproteobacteria bacterium]|nr:alpha/beta fold hydrolase [Alphaproteobacteria bacterium]